MPREIKFRVWDEKKCKWHNDDDGYWADTEWAGINELIKSVAHDYEISQYTGLKDENGKEIYEGDIITLRGIYIDGPEEVSFDYGAFGLNGTSFCYGQEELNWENFKVIGNIYENKDLLK